MAKPHRHNTRQTKLNTPKQRPHAPNGLGGGSLSGLLPGRTDPTDADAGRTDVSVDPARRTFERPADVPSRRRRQRPRRRSTLLRLSLQPLLDDSVDTTPMPADGPGPRSRLGGPIVSHSGCCLRRRPRRQPTYLGSRSRPAGRRSTLRSPATANWNRSSQLTAAAALTMRSSISPTKVTRTQRSHSQRTLSSLIFTSLLLARLSHSYRTCKNVRSQRNLTLICRLSRNFFASPLNMCFSHALQSPDSTDSHMPDLPGRAHMQAATAYTWRRKINNSPRADPLTAATPQVEVHANTWRAVLTIAALQ